MTYKFDRKNEVIVCTESNAMECFDMIWALGSDYDGFSDAKDLKRLIDEFVEYAKKGIRFINEKKYTEEDTAEEDEESLLKAEREKKAFING